MSENTVDNVTANKKTSMGLDENVAGALCYFLGFITGIVFFLLEKDNKFVKFHAVQSTAIFLSLMVLNMILSSFLLGIMLLPLVSLAGLIIWIVMMVKAYQGELFKLPVIGDIAEKQAQL